MLFFIFVVVVIGALIYLDSKPKTQFRTRPYTKRTRDTDKPLDDKTNLFIFRSNKKGYLQSDVWQGKRKAVLKRDKYTCQCCGESGIPLHIHHLREYNQLGTESLSSLVSLCQPCHLAWHTKYGFPSTFQDYMNWNFSEQTVKDLRKTINQKELK